MENKSKPRKVSLFLFIGFMAVATVLVFTPIPNKEIIIMIVSAISVISGMVHNTVRLKNSSAVRRTFNAVHILFVALVMAFMFFIVITRVVMK